MQTKANDCYAIDIKSEDATCVIMNGTYVGNISAIYVEYGTLTIYGGTFKIQQLSFVSGKSYELTINCYDANYTDGTAKVTIYGGSFYNFNPAANKAESSDATTNFVADGYTVTSNADDTYTVYTVIEETE